MLIDPPSRLEIGREFCKRTKVKLKKMNMEEK